MEERALGITKVVARQLKSMKKQTSDREKAEVFFSSPSPYSPEGQETKI
jgi:hypothetical protein